MFKVSPAFDVGDIVENRYNSLRGSVVWCVAYPPEMELVFEGGQSLCVHPDDYFWCCSVARPCQALMEGAQKV